MDGQMLAEIEDSHSLLADRSQPACAAALRTLLLEAFKYQAAGVERRQRLVEHALQGDPDAARR